MFGLTRRGAMNEDRISELPEALLLQILSLLATKDAIATSVLSKGWRSLWKMVPRLEFVSPIKKFATNVGRSLLLHQAPVLESLHLRVRDSCDIGDIGVLAGIAFARHVREFVLDVFSYKLVPFPSSLFFSASLETLKLENLIQLHVPSPVSMKSLKTLHLVFVTYKDDESFRNLLSGCPNLENLVLCRDFHLVEVGRSYTIVAPSLKRLSIHDYSDGRFKGGQFTYLLFKIKFPTGAIFYRLVYLEMYTNKAEWWRVLALMLDSSPKLQVLKLVYIDENLHYGRTKWPVMEKWREPEYVPECLLSHLEKFVWTIYNWDREEEIEVATYILRNAKRLKNATISARPIQYKELSKLEERYKMLMELDGVVRASNSCHLVFVE
ncbi:unnamed protein product [Thlaspi arvense]|uniref:F-box domain-containing protein n=1 Tax=Thlaspi arvense TaxID=13288 RepID=A0AAU9SDZ3_THLAR|nr:unnamed protein product [Thlaspi arvense]